MTPLENYKKNGLDMIIHCLNFEKYKLRDFPSNLRQELLTHYNNILIKSISLNSSFTPVYEEIIYILMDSQQKKRIEKIKQIKDKINGTK